jgi:hypothetical protein
MFKAIFRPIIDPIKEAVGEWVKSTQTNLEFAFRELEMINPDSETHQRGAAEFALATLMAPIFFSLQAAWFAIAAIETFGLPFSFIIKPIIAMVSLVLFAMLIVIWIELKSPEKVDEDYVSEDDQLSEAHDKAVKAIPEDQWWSARAPAVMSGMLGMMLTLLLRVIGKGPYGVGGIGYAVAMVFLGVSFFLIAATKQLPSALIASLGLFVAIIGMILFMWGLPAAAARGAVLSSFIAGLFVSSMLGLAFMNLERHY